jgi:hypothetical protein
LSTADLLEYKAYKPHILLWALVDKIHLLLKVCFNLALHFDCGVELLFCQQQSFNLAETSSDLCSTWLDWLRHNDQTVLGACEKVREYIMMQWYALLTICAYSVQMLYSYQEELLPIESFQEFFDATGAFIS